MKAGSFTAFVGVLLLSPLLGGCLAPPEPVHPGPSAGSWTRTDSEPWFGYVRYAGMCGAPPCSAAVVVFENGRVLWFAWAGHGWSGEDQERRSGLVVPDERYEDAVRAALALLDERSEVQVSEVRTATLRAEDSAVIRDRVQGELDDATDPGAVDYGCTDVGMPTVVVRGERDWHVDVAPRGSRCGENERPQEAWFRVEEQGAALWGWVAPDPEWNSGA